MSKVRFNRLGKEITEHGYASINDFIERNNLKVNYASLYNWLTKKTTVYPQSLVIIDAIADALDSTRNDVLNMISTDPIYDAKFVKDYKARSTKNKSKLQLLRETAGYNASEVASAISTEADVVDAQFVYDIENGKRRNFPSSSVMKNYMELFDLSFVKLYEMQDEACSAYNEADRKARGVRTARTPSTSELGKIRCDLGLTIRKVAESIGIDNPQFITDLEHGRRKSFPTDEIRDKYIALMGITLEEFNCIIEKLTKERLEQLKKENKTMLDKIYDTAEGKEKDWEYKTKCTADETPKVEEVIENPHREDKPLLPAEDMQKVMTLLYGKVDFNTFKTIENILGGKQ